MSNNEILYKIIPSDAAQCFFDFARNEAERAGFKPVSIQRNVSVMTFKRPQQKTLEAVKLEAIKSLHCPGAFVYADRDKATLAIIAANDVAEVRRIADEYLRAHSTTLPATESADSSKRPRREVVVERRVIGPDGKARIESPPFDKTSEERMGGTPTGISDADDGLPPK